MTGPEHYAEAEGYLREAADLFIGSDDWTYYVQVAQVHATLALAAEQRVVAEYLAAPQHFVVNEPSGDFDPAEIRRGVERFFGRVS